MKRCILALCLSAMGMNLALPVLGADLGQAQLLISGTQLKVNPAQQTVPYSTSTLVFTELEGFDAELGTLPGDLKVVGDFSGPEINGISVLETVPNEPFRIPRLTLKGQYTLDNIRLEQAGIVLAYAEPRQAGILVTQILVTSVQSRPLTLDEIRARGIVIDEDNFQPFNFTFGFGVGDGSVQESSHDRIGRGTVSGSPPTTGWFPIPRARSFVPPKVVPFRLTYGGCGGNSAGNCVEDFSFPLVSAMVIPFDNTVLHQFFSVMSATQNGAPEGDALFIRNLTAQIDLPAALREAETEPPTPLGVPVPVRVPGPDGELGTGDDDPILNGQETGKAEFLLEGLREGNHIVDIHLNGILEGLPTGLQTVEATAKGAILVRDPTFDVVLTHPARVQQNQEYNLRLSITNTANAIANLVNIRIPTGALAGAEVLGSNERLIETLLPGQTESLSFHMRSRVAGRVMATAINAGDGVNAAIELSHEVGNVTEPLPPNVIVMPVEAESLPEDLVTSLFSFLGQAFTVATTPASSLEVEFSEVSRGVVEYRANQLAVTGRYFGLGGSLFDSSANLALEWLGVQDGDWEWDALRRETPEGSRFGFELGRLFAEEAATSNPADFFNRLVKANVDLPTHGAVMVEGPGVELEVASRTSDKRVFGSGIGSDRIRELPFADLYELGSAQLALLAQPEEGGYQVRYRQLQAGTSHLRLLVPSSDGDLRVASWDSIPSLTDNGLALLDFSPGDTSLTLLVDVDGDTIVDHTLPATVSDLTPPPLEVVSALQNGNADETGHVVELVFSRLIDLNSLLPADASHFTVEGKLSNGGITGDELRLIDQGLPVRVLRVVFDNPLNPFTAQTLTVRDIDGMAGDHLEVQTLAVDSNIDTPGIQVSGRVIGPDGNPIPYAPVALFELDYSPYQPGDDKCIMHQTGGVLADAGGAYSFDYVRRTVCDGVFELRATDPEQAHGGKIQTRIQSDGDLLIDITMLGRGRIHGTVRYDDGSPASETEVLAENTVQQIIKGTITDANGNYLIDDVPVGAVTLFAQAPNGSFTNASIEVEQAGSVVEKDLTLTSVVEQHFGGLQGRVIDAEGQPVYRAVVTVRHGVSTHWIYGRGFTDEEGRFTFDHLPAEISLLVQAHSSSTGQQGGRTLVTLPVDGIAEVDILFSDLRASVEGYTYILTDTGLEPSPGAIVWADQTPENTVSDQDGFYRLDGLLLGNHRIKAIDATHTLTDSQNVSLGEAGEVQNRDLIFEPVVLTGVQGKVYGLDGLPVEGAEVHLKTGPTQWLGEAYTDDEGFFELQGIPKGHYEVHATQGSRGGFESVAVLASGHVPWVDVFFKEGSIRGQVQARQENGSLAGVQTVIKFRVPMVAYGLVTQAGVQVLETDADGFYEIPDVLMGEYTIAAYNPFYGTKWASGELFANGQEDVQDFVFELAGTVRGIVYDHDGITPVTGVDVTLNHSAFEDYTVTTDDEGKFAFLAVPPSDGFSISAFWDAGSFYRVGRIRVGGFRQGQNLDTEITLRSIGMVTGTVVDWDGNPMPQASVVLQELSYPNKTYYAVSDGEGAFAFSNVFTGDFSVKATTANGQYNGRTVTVLHDDGDEVLLQVSINTGDKVLAGQIISPVDGQGVPSALLKLRGPDGEYSVADSQGRYRFEGLRDGDYQIQAYDNATGRGGKTSWVTIYAISDDIEDFDLVLGVRGRVEGQLTDGNDGSPVGGETVKLTGRGGIFSTGGSCSGYCLRSLEIYSTTDVEGLYSFAGVSEGDFTLSAKEDFGRRSASASGEIVAEDEIVTLNLAWQRDGVVVGRVLKPDGSGDIFEGATFTKIYETKSYSSDFYFVGSSIDNPYRFEDMILNKNVKIVAQEEGGNHEGTATMQKDESAEQTIDVEFVPIGSLEVTVTDSNGQILPSTNVKVRLRGFYSNNDLFGQTDATGKVTFPNVGQGTFSATATTTAATPILGAGFKGSNNGSLESEGQLALLTVAIQEVGQVKGRVLQSDGLTPAPNALLSLTYSNKELIQYTDGLGEFDFPAVPLVSFEIVVLEDGPGQERFAGSLQSNNETLDVGDVVLDDEDPQIIEAYPVANQASVPLDSEIFFRFSEPIDLDHFSNNWIRMNRNGQSISTTKVWSENYQKLTLIPYFALQSLTHYQITIQDKLQDEAGRTLRDGLAVSFVTEDTVPPEVTMTSPVDGTINVATDTNLRVVFSEPMAESSLEGSFQLIREIGEEAVPFDLEFHGNEREVKIFPIDLLDQDHSYRLTVEGVTDLQGNPLVIPAVITFRTLDVSPPLITSFAPPDGTTFLAGDTVPIEVNAIDNVGVTEVRFRLGDRVFVDYEAPYSWNPKAQPVAESMPIGLVAEAVDAAGNLTVESWTVLVEPFFDPSQPQLSLVCPSTTILLAPDTGLDLQFDLFDDVDLAALDFFLDGEETPFETIPESELANGPYTYHFVLPSSYLPGQSVQLRVVLRDFGGSEDEELIEVRVPSGTIDIIDSDFRISPDILTYEGRSVVVTGGTLTVDYRPIGDEGTGYHQFKNLVVLDGAQVTTSDNSYSHYQNNAFDWKLKVDIEEDLFVACTGAITANGEGYSRTYTYGWDVKPDSSGYAATYAGWGNDPWGYIYGNLFRPFDLGAGGARYSSNGNGGGGGAVHLRASGEMILDGSLSSSGHVSSAGGSVLLETSVLRGRGSIEASALPFSKPGSGGRIALYTDVVEESLWPRIQASGASAGTIFWKGSQHPYGELIVDGAGRDIVGFTELLPVGEGSVDVITATGFTDADASFAHTLAGAYVGFDGDESALWKILGNEHLGQDLELEFDAGSNPLPTAPATYQGAYQFDAVKVRNGARLLVYDRLLAPTIEVDESSVLVNTDENADLDATIHVGENPAVEGETLHLGALAASLEGLDYLDLTLTGVVTAQEHVDLAGVFSTSKNFTYTPSMSTATGWVDAQLVVVDLAGNSQVINERILVIENDVSASFDLSPDPVAQGEDLGMSITGGATSGVDYLEVTLVGAVNHHEVIDFTDSRVVEPTLHFTPTAISDIEWLDATLVLTDQEGESTTVEKRIMVMEQSPAAQIEFDPAVGQSGVPTTLRLLGASSVGVESLEIEVSGAAVESDFFEFSGEKSVVQEVVYTPEWVGPGAAMEVTFRVYQTDGAMVEIQRSYPVVGDTTPPVVAITAPVPLATYTSGDAITVTFTASDDVDLDRVEAELGGYMRSRNNEGSLTLYAPPISQTGQVPISVTAYDHVGNATLTQVWITVEPLESDVEPPVISAQLSSCFGQTPTVYPGQEVHFFGSFTEEQSLFVIEILEGETVLDTIFPLSGGSGYNFSFDFVVPGEWDEEAPHTVHFRATDFGDNQALSVESFTFEVWEGTVLSGQNVAIGEDDLSFENQTVIVTDGTTLTLDGTHRFERLMVVPYGVVTHSPTDANHVFAIDLEVDHIYLSKCGSLRVDGLGYPHDYTYPGVLSNAGYKSGGSHGGRGGGTSPMEYDSLFDPQLPGSGGGGVAGGGIIRILASGTASLNGIVSANGYPSSSGGGAGGSIYIDADIIEGSGSASAVGGTGISFGSGGGGGRVAYLGNFISDDWVENTNIRGGNASAGYRKGSAGTLYVKRDHEALGSLIMDNGGIESTVVTQLMPVGASTVDAITADSITDFEAEFHQSLVGLEVAFNYDYLNLWPITFHEHLGDTLSLDVSQQALTAQGGDLYRGVLRLDTLTVRGGALAATENHVVVVGDTQIDPGSTWTPGNESPPSLDAGLTQLSQGKLGLTVEGDPGAVVDSDLPLQARVRNLSTGQEFSSTVAADGSFEIYVSAGDGQALEVWAEDSGLPPLSSLPVPLSPVTGDTGIQSTPSYSGNALVLEAVNEDLMAIYSNDFVFEEGGPVISNHRVEIFDLSIPFAPILASTVDVEVSGGGGGGGDCVEACVRCSLECGSDPACQEACGSCFDTCQSTGDCGLSCGTCWDICNGSGSGPFCTAACGACDESCGSGGGGGEFSAFMSITLPNGTDELSAMAIEGDALVMLQGNDLRVVDISDPYTPFHNPGTMDISGVGGEFSQIRLEQGYLYLLNNGSEQNFKVFDLHDPQSPREINSADLSAEALTDMKIIDGDLHLLRYQPTEEYQLFNIGDGAAPLRETGSEAAGSRGSTQLSVIGDLAYYTNNVGQLFSFHRYQAPTDPPRESHDDLPYTSVGALVELGDRALQVAGRNYEPTLLWGSLDDSFDGHGFFLEQEMMDPFPEGVDTISVQNRVLWFASVADGEQYLGWIRGFQSTELLPWIEEDLLTLAPTVDGVRITGTPGAAEGATLVEGATDLDSGSVAVQPDGSFLLDITGPRAGEKITLQASDSLGHRGHKLRLDIPLGPVDRLAVSVGAAHLAVDGALAAVAAVREDEGVYGVTLVDLSGPTLTATSTVNANGPISNVYLYLDHLYVASGTLQIWNVSDPANPVGPVSLDLFAGAAPLALAGSGSDLLIAGPHSGQLEMKVLDLASSATAPSETGSISRTLVGSPRLKVLNGDLWLSGEALLEKYLLSGGALSLDASAVLSTEKVGDLESSNGGIYAAVTSEGVREVVQSGATLTLGAAPSPPHHVFGLFEVPRPGADQLWWAEFLGGIKTRYGDREIVPGVMVPVRAHLSTGCAIYDGVVVGGDLLLWTDCGLDRVELLP